MDTTSKHAHDADHDLEALRAENRRLAAERLTLAHALARQIEAGRVTREHLSAHEAHVLRDVAIGAAEDDPAR